MTEILLDYVKQQTSLPDQAPRSTEGKGFLWNAAMDVGEAIFRISEAWHDLNDVIGDVASAVINTEAIGNDAIRSELLKRNLSAQDGYGSWEEIIVTKGWHYEHVVQENAPIIDRASRFAARSSGDKEAEEAGISVEVKSMQDSIDLAGQYAEALRKLFPPDNGPDISDDGFALRELVNKHGVDRARQALREFSTNPIKIKDGRTPGPNPVTKHILELSPYIKALYQCKTRGEIFERIIQHLEQRDDVKAWSMISKPYYEATGMQRIKQELKLPDVKNYGVEVQVYALLEPFIGDRQAGALKLEEIENNEKRRQKKRQPR